LWVSQRNVNPPESVPNKYQPFCECPKELWKFSYPRHERCDSEVYIDILDPLGSLSPPSHGHHLCHRHGIKYTKLLPDMETLSFSFSLSFNLILLVSLLVSPLITQCLQFFIHFTIIINNHRQLKWSLSENRAKHNFLIFFINCKYFIS